MRALLDTSTFLWWITDSPQLSKKVKEIISDADNEIYFSAVSAWEIGIKISLKKLKLTNKPEAFIVAQQNKNNFLSLPLSVRHAAASASLPHHHKDPFDRMLICQANAEKLSLLTSDRWIKKYDVDVIW